MRSLRTRYLVAFLAVALTGAVVFAVAVRLVLPTLFDHQMGNGEHMMEHGGGNANGTQRAAVISSLNWALVIALVCSGVVAVVLAVWLSRRELARLDGVRAATRRMAAGDYSVRVDVPSERELAALAGDVNHLASTLEETEQRRAALVNDVAHEMRTPLTTMAGAAEGYRDGLYTADELADTTAAETVRLQRLAADLAAVSRVDEGRLQLEVAADDLSAIVRTVVDRFGRRFADAGLVLDAPDHSPVPVTVDRERVVQALGNLLDNALAYTPSGGRVDVAVATTDGTAIVRVSDTGRGLTPEQLTQVFERFYRADPGGHARGTGVGLTIARAIARAHGGDLTAASPGVGQGAAFTFSVPLSPGG